MVCIRFVIFGKIIENEQTMTLKKIFSYIFIGLSILLTFIIIGKFETLISAVVNFFKLISGQLNSYQAGQVVVEFIYWFFLLAITIFLWIIGRRWMKRKIKIVRTTPA